MANDNDKATPGGDGNRSKVAEAMRSMADAIDQPTKLGGMAYTATMVSVAVLSALGVLIGLINSKLAERIFAQAGGLIETMFIGVSGAGLWIKAKIQKILWLYGLWILGTVVMTIVAIAVPWTTLADIILIALAVMPYVMALVVQALVSGLMFGREDKKELALTFSRQFAVVSIVEFFIAAGVLFLPAGLSGFYVVTALGLMGMIICAYSALLGRKRNVMYHVMVLATIVMASVSLAVHALDTVAKADTPVGVLAQNVRAAFNAGAYSTAGVLRDVSISEYTVIKEGNLDVNGNLVKLAKGTKIVRDRSVKPQYPDGLPERYLVTVVGGTNDGQKGWFSSTLMKSVTTPEPKARPQLASAPALVPVAVSVPSVPEPADTLEVEVTAKAGEWEDIPPSSLVPEAGDMLIWGPLDDSKEFSRLESIVGLNTEEALKPAVFDNVGGGFVGKTGITRNDHDSPMRFRVTEGEPITLKVKVKPGEYAKYLKRKGG